MGGARTGHAAAELDLALEEIHFRDRLSPLLGRLAQKLGGRLSAALAAARLSRGTAALDATERAVADAVVAAEVTEQLGVVRLVLVRRLEPRVPAKKRDGERPARTALSVTSSDRGGSPDAVRARVCSWKACG